MIVMVLITMIVMVLITMIVMVLITMAGVVPITFARFQRLNSRNDLVNGHPFFLGRLDHVDEAFFEVHPIDNQNICIEHPVDFLCRSLKLVRISAHWHDRDDLSLAVEELADHITQDVRRDDNGRNLAY